MPRKRRAILPVAMLTLCLAAIPGCPGSSDPISSITEFGLTSMTVDQVFGKVQQTIDQLSARLENSGETLGTKFGNELNTALTNAHLAIKEERQALVRDLNHTQQNVIAELERIRRTAEDATDRAVSIEEMANLDLIELTNRIQVVSDKILIYFSSSRGLTAIQDSTSHQITITGLGFGFENPEVKYTTTFSLNGNQLPANTISSDTRNQAIITLTPEMIADIGHETEVRNVPLSISIDAIKERTIFSDIEQDAVFDLKFTVMPEIAGYLEAEEVLNKQKWGPKKTHTLVKNVSASSTDHPNDWQQSWRCANNQRIVQPIHYDCEGPGCPWSYHPGGGYEPAYDISGDKKTITVRRHCDGAHCTVRHKISYQELVEYTQTQNPEPIPVRYGEPFSLLLAKKNKNAQYKLAGTLVTGHKIAIDNTLQQSGPVQFVSSGQYDNRTKINFKLNIP